MTSPEPDHVHVRLPTLRRLALDEPLPAGEAAEAHAALDACEACRDRLAALVREHEAFCARSDAAAASVRILARLEDAEAPSRALTSAWRRVLPALAVAAGALVFSPLLSTDEPASGPTVRTKGAAGPGLVMFVKDAAGVRRAEDGAELSAGDAVQFRYDAGGHAHLFVVSVDARGAVSPLYPDRPGASIRVEPEGTHLLEGSVILDDAVGPERIFAVFSRAPRRFDELAAAARQALADGAQVERLSRLPVEGDDVAQVSVLLLKRGE